MSSHPQELFLGSRIQCILLLECHIRSTQVRRGDKSDTQVKNFDFDNHKSENIFSYTYISYMANERLQREEQFYSKNYILEMSCFHTKMCFKSTPQKLSFVMAKAIPKSYTLYCSCKYLCTFPNSYGQQRRLVFGKKHFM